MIRSLRKPEQLQAGGVLVLIALIACVLSGAWHRAQWLPVTAASQSAPLAKLTAAPRVELASLGNAWQVPLFSVDRSPDLTKHDNQTITNLNGLTLTGVFLDGDVQFAYVHQANGPTLKVQRTQLLPNGWTLRELSPSAVTFSLGERRETMYLRRPKLPPPATQTPPPHFREDVHESAL